MAVEEPNVVDAVGLDVASGEAVLSILDSLAWEDERQHLLMLQDKVNCYLGFIESGELDINYPDAIQRSRRIDVIFRHTPPESALALLGKAGDVAKQYSCALNWKVQDV
jgi:hypothetical protein